MNRIHGLYFGARWSENWQSKTPWSLDKKDMPYIGHRFNEYGDRGGVGMVCIGPFAIVYVVIK